MRQDDAAIDAAVPAELVAALAGHVIALLLRLVTATERAPPRARLPTSARSREGLETFSQAAHGEHLGPHGALLLVHLARRGAGQRGMRPEVTLRTEAMALDTGWRSRDDLWDHHQVANKLITSM